ncbi:hypothetical protein Ahy_A03g015320 [Arachis hypogaea]|uniref:Uncharacterized protein n=1 Tax=Arachis hypogaea TaxID=3818 RepID=A0A445E043_ARAHY|nr:hypothetical protein Ahy_A03g015320 [Arachis hypogaea]
MAFSFYADLYNDSLPDHPFVLNNAFPQLNAKDLYSVGRNIFELDIKEAIFHIGRFKYPGRDGLQAIFYQSQWDHLGPNLCSLVERRRNESNLWKGIRKSWDNVQQNYIWRIEDGSKINFWNNNWVPNIGSLAPYANQIAGIMIGSLLGFLMRYPEDFAYFPALPLEARTPNCLEPFV